MFFLPRYKYFFAVSDFLLFILLFFFSAHTTSYLKPHLFDIWVNNYLVLVPYVIFSAVFVFVFQTNNLYKISVVYGGAIHFLAIFKSLFIIIIILIVFSFLFKLQFILESRYFILSFAIYAIFLFPFIRIILLHRLVKNYYIYYRPKKNILIYGAGDSGKLLGAKLMFEREWGNNLVGFLDDFVEKQTKVVADKVVLGNISNMERLCKEIKTDEIIVSISTISYDRLIEVIDLCNDIGVSVKLSSDLFSIIHSKLPVDKYSNIPVVDVSPRIGKALNLYYKKTFDYIFAFIGILILSPFFIAIAFLIKITSNGPVFYKQKRIGIKGKPFIFYKFRSMKVTLEGEEKREQEMIKFMKNKHKSSDKIINEQRVTSIGKFIRKTSLDELPQLFNVLKGEMSLVGPRPGLPYEYENYDEWQKKRLAVLPGCTGVWQVFGRNNVSFQNSVVLDIYYLTNMSPWLDLLLILKTIPVMLFAKGGK